MGDTASPPRSASSQDRRKKELNIPQTPPSLATRKSRGFDDEYKQSPPEQPDETPSNSVFSQLPPPVWDLDKLREFEEILQKKPQNIAPTNQYDNLLLDTLIRTGCAVMSLKPDGDQQNTAPSCYLDELVDDTSEAFGCVEGILGSFERIPSDKEEEEMVEAYRKERFAAWLDELDLENPEYDDYRGMLDQEEETIADIWAKKDAEDAEDADRRASTDNIATHRLGSNTDADVHDQRSFEHGHSAAQTSDNGNVELDDANGGGTIEAINQPEEYSDKGDEREDGLVPVAYTVHIRYPLPNRTRVLWLRRRYKYLKAHWSEFRTCNNLPRWFRLTRNLLRLIMRVLKRKMAFVFDVFLDAAERQDGQESFYYSETRQEPMSVVWPEPWIH